MDLQNSLVKRHMHGTVCNGGNLWIVGRLCTTEAAVEGSFTAVPLSNSTKVANVGKNCFLFKDWFAFFNEIWNICSYIMLLL